MSESSRTENKFEIVKFCDNSFELEVNVSPKEETVWLDVNQLSLLFDVNVPAIVKHVSNIIASDELDSSTISILEKVQVEGNRLIKRKQKLYNLDMIIAIGYRVNSKRGTLFRKWANSILKQYLLKGYAIEQSRVLVTQENYLNLVNAVNRIDNSQEKLSSRVEKLEAKYLEMDNMLFFDGQLWDAVSCIETIFTEAKKTIVLIDNYTDTQTLDMLSKKNTDVSVILVTDKRASKLTQKEISAFNTQYGKLNILYSKEFHDRFIIVDDTIIYHCGASIKDAGRKTFAISRIDDPNYLQALLQKTDSFYSPTNQRFLKESIKSLKAGKGIKHDLIDPDGTDLHGPFNSIEELMEDLNADD